MGEVRPQRRIDRMTEARRRPLNEVPARSQNVIRCVAIPARRSYRGAIPRWSALALCALVSLALAGSASADQYSSLNKITAAASVTGLNLSGAGQRTSVELRGSRKNRMLVVHATVVQNAFTSPQSVSVSVTANGVALEPGSVANTCQSNDCAVSTAYFLDLAQAEAANPGVIYNTLPLNVEIQGYSTAVGGNGKLAMVAELLKK